MRVVLDTSVVIAGLWSQHGASRLWLNAVMSNRHTLIVSVPLMIEYEAVARRPEHVAAIRLTSAEIGDYFDDLCSVAERIQLRYRLIPSERFADSVAQKTVTPETATRLHAAALSGALTACSRTLALASPPCFAPPGQGPGYFRRAKARQKFRGDGFGAARHDFVRLVLNPH